RRADREFQAWHARSDGTRARRAADNQSRSDPRAHLGLRPDRALCAAARLRHAGRGDERPCRAHRLSRPRAGAAAAGARRHDRRPLWGERGDDGALRASALRRARAGHRRVAARSDVLRARSGSRDFPRDRRRETAHRKRVEHDRPAQRLSLRRRQVRGDVGLDPEHGETRVRSDRARRSLLYVPASSEKFLARAHERGADALILDLEDAVAPQEKLPARARLQDAVPSVGRDGAKVFVRINSGEPGLDDAAAACRAGAFGLFVPKVRAAADVSRIDAQLSSMEHGTRVVLMPMLEDAGAVLEARTIAAASARTFALVAGSEDMATAMGAEPTPEVLRLPKLLVHLAAKAAGLFSF